MSKLLSCISIIAFFVVFFSSCSEDKYPGFERSPEGVYYKVHYKGGVVPTPNDSDWFVLRMDYRLEDTLLYSSSQSGGDMTIPNIPPMFEGDIYDGLKLMGDGDSMTFAIVADSFFFKTVRVRKLPPFVKAGSPMYFDIKLLKRYTNEEYKDMLATKKAETEAEQNEKLRIYLETNMIDIEPLESGLFFIPIKEGKGKRPDTGDMCKVFLEVKELNGDLLFSNFGGNPVDVEFGKGFDTEGFRQGLGMLRVGGKADLIVPYTIGVGTTGREAVEPYSTLLYTIQLENIISVEQVKKERAERKKAQEIENERMKKAEEDKIKEYIVKNNITEKQRASGLYIVLKQAGGGKMPVEGDKVKVHYSVYNLEGELLQSSKDKGEPYEFVVGKGMVIKAWDEAIVNIKPGSLVQLIVPSKLAYGSRGSGKDIPPYTPLIFDIELIEVDK